MCSVIIEQFLGHRFIAFHSFFYVLMICAFTVSCLYQKCNVVQSFADCFQSLVSGSYFFVVPIVKISYLGLLLLIIYCGLLFFFNMALTRRHVVLVSDPG